MAGLLDFLNGGQAQMPGQQPSGLARLFQPEIALPMAAALLGGQGNAQNFGNAFAAGGQAFGQQKELQAQTAQRNQTVEMLKREAPDIAQGVEMGALTPGDGYKIYLDRRKAQKGQGIINAGAGNLYNADTGEWLSAPGGGAEGVAGLTPVWLRDENGNMVIGQATKDGKIVRSEMPEGLSPLGPYDKAFQTGSGNAAGKVQGEATGSFNSMSSKMAGLETVITQLDELAEKATYTAAGQILDIGRAQMGLEPREAAVARTEYIATVDNQILPLLRDTFGAQFTVEEGKALRATLGDPNKTPVEKQAVLKAFIEQKRRDVQALGVQSGQMPVTAPQRLRFNPATGDFE